MNDFTLKNEKIIVCAKSKSGKSEIVKYLVNLHRKKFYKIFAISSTELVNNFYSSFIDPKCVYTKINEKWLQTLINKLIENKDKKLNVLLIFDDINDKLMQSDIMEYLFKAGRHMNIAIILILQYLHQVPPIIRVNTSFVLCGQMNHQSLEILCDNFINTIISKKEFIKMFHDNVKDYNFLLINNNAVKNSNNVNDLYGLMKAEI